MRGFDRKLEQISSHHVAEFDSVLDSLGLSGPESEIDSLEFALSAAHLVNFVVAGNERMGKVVATDLYFLLKRSQKYHPSDIHASSYVLGIVLGDVVLRPETSYCPAETENMLERSVHSVKRMGEIHGLDVRRPLLAGFVSTSRKLEDSESPFVRRAIRDLEDTLYCGVNRVGSGARRQDVDRASWWPRPIQGLRRIAMTSALGITPPESQTGAKGEWHVPEHEHHIFEE